MGGKSRKMGMPSKRLIAVLKAARAPARNKERADRECEDSLKKMGDKIIERIKQDAEDWNSSLAAQILEERKFLGRK